MTSTPTNYPPGYVKCQGFGQSPENPAPSLFLESIAINQDCSVYSSLFVTLDGTFGENVQRIGNTMQFDH